MAIFQAILWNKVISESKGIRESYRCKSCKQVDMDEAVKELLKYKPIYPFASNIRCPMANNYNVMERGNKQMAINYVPWNAITVRFKYPRPCKDALRTHSADNGIYNKFDDKSRIYHIKPTLEDFHKTTSMASRS